LAVIDDEQKLKLLVTKIVHDEMAMTPSLTNKCTEVCYKIKRLWNSDITKIGIAAGNWKNETDHNWLYLNDNINDIIDPTYIQFTKTEWSYHTSRLQSENLNFEKFDDTSKKFEEELKKRGL
jgi:hypothetical protein